MGKKQICENHDLALSKIQVIRDGIKQTVKNKDCCSKEELIDLLEDIEFQLSYAEDYIEEAKESGQSMEKRLNTYNNAIENLGFARLRYKK